MKPRPYSRPYADTVFAPFAVRVAEIEANVRAVLDAPVAPDLSHRLHARAALLHIRALRAALAASDVGAAADAALQLGAEAELPTPRRGLTRGRAPAGAVTTRLRSVGPLVLSRVRSEISGGSSGTNFSKRTDS